MAAFIWPLPSVIDHTFFKQTRMQKKKLCCNEYLDIFVSTRNPYLAFKHQRELFYVQDMLQNNFLYFLPLRFIVKYIAAASTHLYAFFTVNYQIELQRRIFNVGITQNIYNCMSSH